MPWPRQTSDVRTQYDADIGISGPDGLESGELWSDATVQIRVAVVGAGPSGLYAVDALTSQHEVSVTVDVLDRLPVPFGLVRYGVAPDHVALRGVRDTLTHVFERAGVRFLGGVELGRDVSAQELLAAYDAVILTYGAATDRHLEIPGEELPGSIAATDLVAWYCGHPDADRERIEQALALARQVVVIGVGNVAVDVTRVLAKTVAELEHTDMPQHVLDALRASRISDIYVLGRRGPTHATWTTKELRELGELVDADVAVDPAQLAGAVHEDRHIVKNMQVLKEFSERATSGKSRRIHLNFFARPLEVLGDQHVEGVQIERTTVDESGAAHGTGVTWTQPAQLVVRSVGYRGVGLAGVPFDAARAVIPNVDGRVVDGDRVVPGLYVAGWIKRGPTGIIGTNKKDAAATVAAVLIDAATGSQRRDWVTLDELLLERSVTRVDYAGWLAIDAAERAEGARRGRDRTTLHLRQDLHEAGGASHPIPGY